MMTAYNLNAHGVLSDIYALPFLHPFSSLLSSIIGGVCLNYMQNCSYCLKENTTCVHCKNQVLSVFSENGFLRITRNTQLMCVENAEFLNVKQVVYIYIYIYI